MGGRARWAVAVCTVGMLWGCPDGGGGGGGGGDENDAVVIGDAEVDAAPSGVPYTGEIAALPDDAELDERSFYPTPVGGVWRYRKKPDVIENLPPVTEGGEAEIVPGEGENEFVRTLTLIIDLPVDGEMTKVRQTIRETYVVEPPVELVGPIVRFKRLEIDERAVEDQRFVREVIREYDPPYKMISDAWRTGTFDTRLEFSDIRMYESVLRRGQEEPTVLDGVIVNVQVTTSDRPQILPIEGAYRDELRQVDVVDDLAGSITRTYWVQQGIGAVQLQYRDANNVLYTLTETNLETPAAE
ncbi:MAG: hypothetical protein KC620_21385 [Myxococcales bacterium]|nr:hypothetical protein [Myxococcales bacterium]